MLSVPQIPLIAGQALFYVDKEKCGNKRHKWMCKNDFQLAFGLATMSVLKKHNYFTVKQCGPVYQRFLNMVPIGTRLISKTGDIIGGIRKLALAGSSYKNNENYLSWHKKRPWITNDFR